MRKSKTLVEGPVESEIAFSFMVRYHRIKKHKRNLTRRLRKTLP